jgi:hypothetical protein
MSENIALLFFGQHYAHIDNHFQLNYHHVIDYRHYRKNIKEKLINNFNNIDIYTCTNNSHIENEFINDYNLKNYIFSNDTGKRNIKIVKGLELIFNSGIHYNYIIITRPDIYFMDDITPHNIDLNKLNLVSILEHDNLVDDNLYIMPNKYFHKFYEIYSKLRDEHQLESHYLKSEFHNNFEINYLRNENNYVTNLSFYKLRYYCCIMFILNKNHFDKNVFYHSMYDNCVIILQDDSINLHKVRDYRCEYCWVGLNLNKGNYNIEFDVITDKDINQLKFLKLHNPERYIDINQHIEPHIWTRININFEVTNNEDLFIWILDDFCDKLSFTIKDIKINNDFI